MGTKNQAKTIVMIVTVLAILGFGLNAVADDGQGYGRMGKGRYYNEDGGKGSGRGPGYCGRYGDSLSAEAREKADAERQAFFEATRELRQHMFQKDLELRAELAKQTPDAEKAAGIQKELSNLRAEIDQAQLEHRLRMKAINPALGMGYGGRSDGGGGPGFARRADGSGRGRCWE